VSTSTTEPSKQCETIFLRVKWGKMQEMRYNLAFMRNIDIEERSISYIGRFEFTS
jgi:hypothetical protein